jgi:hypothetical protein
MEPKTQGPSSSKTVTHHISRTLCLSSVAGGVENCHYSETNSFFNISSFEVLGGVSVWAKSFLRLWCCHLWIRTVRYWWWAWRLLVEALLADWQGLMMIGGMGKSRVNVSEKLHVSRSPP